MFGGKRALMNESPYFSPKLQNLQVIHNYGHDYSNGFTDATVYHSNLTFPYLSWCQPLAHFRCVDGVRKATTLPIHYKQVQGAIQLRCTWILSRIEALSQTQMFINSNNIHKYKKMFRNLQASPCFLIKNVPKSKVMWYFSLKNPFANMFINFENFCDFNKYL